MAEIRQFSEGEDITIERLNEMVQKINEPQIRMRVAGNEFDRTDGLRIEAMTVVPTAMPSSADSNLSKTQGSVKFLQPFTTAPVVVANWGHYPGIHHIIGGDQRLWSALVIATIDNNGFTYFGTGDGLHRVNYIAIGY